MNNIDIFLFIVLPYLAVVIFFVGTIYRYRYNRFSYSSLSSQFLENNALFYGSQAFHWGIIFLFFGHLIGFIFPATVTALNNQPVRILIIEGTALIAGLVTLAGMIILIYAGFLMHASENIRLPWIGLLKVCCYLKYYSELPSLFRTGGVPHGLLLF